MLTNEEQGLSRSFTGRMSDGELLAAAVAFDVGPEAFINGRLTTKRGGKYFWKMPDGESVEVEFRYHVQVQYTGSQWVVSNGPACLNTAGEWEHFSMPSEQEDDFRHRTRFDTPRHAIEFFQRHRSWEWDIYESLKDTFSGRALWEELERRLADRYANQG